MAPFKMLTDYPEKIFEHTVTHMPNTCVLRIDLTDTTAGRDAVYIVRVVQHGSTYEVMTHWGRRGKSLSSKNIGTYSHMGTALSIAKEAAAKKSKKNYVVQFEANPGSGTVPAQPVSIPCNLPNGLNFMPVTNPYKNPPIDKYLTNDYAFEVTPPEDYWVYIMIHGGNWRIFDKNRTYIESVAYRHYGTNAKEFDYYENYVFIGFKTGNGNYAIFDISTGDHANVPLKNVENNPWKLRRVMLSSVFNDIYRNADPFDSNFDVYLNDYTYTEQDKRNMFNVVKPLNYCVLMRNINDKLYMGIDAKV